MPRKKLHRPALPARPPLLPRRSPPAPAPPAPVQLWAGWARRPRGHWQLIVRCAESEDIAMARLREMTASSKFIDLCVRLASRGSPDDDRPVA